MADLRTRILNNPALDAMRAVRDIAGLADALNAEGFKDYGPRFISARAILTACPGGIAILTALQQASADTAVSWALKFLGQDAGLDIGDPGVYPLLDQLVASAVLTAAQIKALKDMALAPVTVNQIQVADVLYNADGSDK